MSVAATIGALGTAAAAGINAATSEARNAKSYKYTKRLQDEQNRHYSLLLEGSTLD